MVGTVEVRRAGERGLMHPAPGIASRHSFSFGAHLDPGNTHHGVLLAHHEDRLAPGAGYDDHPHRDTEIVTWVLSGTLVHTDDAGRSVRVPAGSVQRLSAGRGVVHSERNGTDEPCHFVQSWLVPDESGVEPVHESADVSAALADGRFVPVAAAAGPGPGVGLGVADATLHVARLSAGERATVPDAPLRHLFVARGEVAVVGAAVGETDLHAGDTVRLAEPSAAGLRAHTDSEILVWEMHSDLAHPDLAPSEGER